MRRRAPEWMRRKVKAIDADLDVVFLEVEQKWAIIQKLHNTPSVEDLTLRVAHELQDTLLKEGRVADINECAIMAYPVVSESMIVFRLEDENGTPRPLDERALTTLRECAWKYRNYRLSDWIEAGRTLRYEAQRRREAATRAIWEAKKKDKVFRRCLSNVLHGLAPNRSVHGRPELQQATA